MALLIILTVAAIYVFGVGALMAVIDNQELDLEVHEAVALSLLWPLAGPMMLGWWVVERILNR